jgi:large-conductance mechanosensitive channel
MKNIIRLAFGIVIAIALFTSVRLLIGSYITPEVNLNTCHDITPDGMFLAAQVPESVETGVDVSFWPLSPICHWQFGIVKASKPLFDWGYTYVFYGGLLVAGVAAITWVMAEIIQALRRRRRDTIRSSR